MESYKSRNFLKAAGANGNRDFFTKIHLALEQSSQLPKVFFAEAFGFRVHVAVQKPIPKKKLFRETWDSHSKRNHVLQQKSQLQAFQIEKESDSLSSTLWTDAGESLSVESTRVEACLLAHSRLKSQRAKHISNGKETRGYQLSCDVQVRARNASDGVAAAKSEKTIEAQCLQNASCVLDHVILLAQS